MHSLSCSSRIKEQMSLIVFHDSIFYVSLTMQLKGSLFKTSKHFYEISKQLVQIENNKEQITKSINYHTVKKYKSRKSSNEKEKVDQENQVSPGQHSTMFEVKLLRGINLQTLRLVGSKKYKKCPCKCLTVWCTTYTFTIIFTFKKQTTVSPHFNWSA